MTNFKIILFKSPTCGPCKMFQPQLELAVKEYNELKLDKQVIFEICDVSTDDGLAKANKFGISSSGEALLLNENESEQYIEWSRPKKAADILNDLKNYI